MLRGGVGGTLLAMLKRLILGLVKGLAIGGALGAALFFGVQSVQQGGVAGVAAYGLYALIGALAGVLAGKPPWLKGAWVESLLKGLFGLAVGAGLFALASRFLGGQNPVMVPAFGGGAEMALFKHPLLMAPGIATIYAMLVELDNTGEVEPEPKSGVRIRSIDDIKVDEDEEAEASSEKGAAKGRR